jgi:hypothetical protein
MKPHLGLLTIACLMVVSSLSRADTKADSPKGDTRAAALMDEAAKTRYVWSNGVTSVSGKFTWEKDGHSGTGSFNSVLHKRGGTTYTAEGTEQVPADVKEHIGSLIGHRTPPTAAAPKHNTPAYIIVVEDDDRGPLIQTVGDQMNSTQRIKDGKMVQVNRMMGGKRFTIDVTEFEKSPDGSHFYPSAFTVTWWDAGSGKKVEKQIYTTQGFYVVDDQMFPKAEKVVSEKDGKTSTLELRYSDIKFETARQKAAGN